MELTNISGRGFQNASETVSIHIEEWSGNLKHHIRQQAIQQANHKIDAPHDVVKISVSQGEWEIHAVLLGEINEDFDLGELFVADSWNWSDSETKISYECDENQQMEQVRERVEEALCEATAEETPFSADMMQLAGVTIQDDFTDSATLAI